jgi:hypothetical protein
MRNPLAPAFRALSIFNFRVWSAGALVSNIGTWNAGFGSPYDRRQRPSLALFLVGTFGLNCPIFTSTMAVKVFHSDARGFGLLSSIMAIGTISGALIAAGRDKPKFGSLFVGSTVFGIGCTFAALAPGYWWFAAALVVIGVAALTLTNATNSMMQLSTAPAMRGRVMALRLAVALGGTPIGAPIVGWVANRTEPCRLGPRGTLRLSRRTNFCASRPGDLFRRFGLPCRTSS